ncbi:uncharacterized protein BDW43DRAFT_312612 [Aspergillus alliaceus]|uniref:uncharacterized protein n=1 Tax=Petromyces alliaceus TaxID=209559 RepID=UPI0012A409CC|nr:uncharacterized protein BDW43DRAFT_312612 [Aspergillus alliaceus]KAB8231996.1 hypothetical protein BDW43DRAFT_312612 [Aspergillus alliaceus]
MAATKPIGHWTSQGKAKKLREFGPDLHTASMQVLSQCMEVPKSLQPQAGNTALMHIRGLCFMQTLIDTLTDPHGVPDTRSRGHLRSTEAQRVGDNKTPTSPMRSLRSVEIQKALPEPDVEQWAKWLATNIPTGVPRLYVQLEAAFRTSCLVPVTVGIEIWTTLRADDKALNVITLVNSSNTVSHLC